MQQVENSLLADIREVNLSYLLLAQRMLRDDYAASMFRLGFSNEVADILMRLSPAQLVKPVSYTHLDVYKRQLQGKAKVDHPLRAGAGNAERRGSREGLARAKLRVIADQGVHRRLCQVGKGLMWRRKHLVHHAEHLRPEWRAVVGLLQSVSYTHLDVYKRQTEDEAKKQGIKVEKGVFPWAASGRAIANGRDEGFTKLLFDAESHRILGGGIVGTHAGDLISDCLLYTSAPTCCCRRWKRPPRRPSAPARSSAASANS